MSTVPWLVRTADNQIAGPYTQEQVRSLILEGRLGLQDEVCAANHYWFFLHEREEVERQLGVQVPRATSPDEEETETGIGRERTDPTRPRPSKPAPAAASEPAPAGSAEPEDAPEQTAMVNAVSLRQQLHTSKRVAPTVTTPESSSQASTAAGRPAASSRMKASAKTPAVAAVLSRARASAPPLRKPLVIGQLERASFWRGFAWLLVVAAGLVVFAVLRLMRQG